MAKGVRTHNPTYDDLSPLWQRCSDCVDGQDEVQKAGERYLPRLTEETTEAYKARVKRSDFYNATWRTIAGLTGMAFRKPPVADIPAAIDAYRADIDLAGTELDDMAKACLEDALEYGAFGLMVDFPTLPENVSTITQAIAERLGLRPMVKRYEIESVINWRYGYIGNRRMLTMVVLKEEASVADDEFSHDTEDRFRVLDLDDAGNYRQRVYRIDKRGEDELIEGPFYPLMNGNPIPYIPFRIVGNLEEPPLIDLVDANIAHYQVNSDYRHGLHFTGLPMLFLAGVIQDEGQAIYIGSSKAITAPDPQAKASYVEFSGQGLQETREALRALEQRMAVLGARMIADETSQVETLGATQIKRQGENSILAALVLEVSRAMEWALGVMAEWAGASGTVAYQISREFNPAGLSAQDLTALLANVQAGKITDREYFDLLQRADVIDGEQTFEAHQEEAASQGPMSPGLAA